LRGAQQSGKKEKLLSVKVLAGAFYLIPSLNEA
jgi:hypothetical protein